MPRRYSIDGEQNVASPTDSVLGLTGGTTTRPEVFKGWIGSEATPADNTIVFYIGRHTAAGTATSVTPQAVDSGDPAAIATAGENHTVEPTLTSDAILFRLGLNQRSTHTLYLEDSPIKVPASANNGLTLYPVHSSFTGLVSATLWFID